MSHIIVIGGGIVGASVTFRLAQMGANVTLLEAGQIAGGTTAGSFAWINSSGKEPDHYHQLNVDGMAELLGLARELGSAPWLHLSGNIEWAEETSDQTALRAKVEKLRSRGYPAELVSREEAQRLEPAIQIGDLVEDVARYPSEGYVYPRLLVGRLVQAAKVAGARVQSMTPVTEILSEGGRVSGVVTKDGDRISADVVVSCLGRWTDRLSDMVGVSVPMAPTIGHLVISSPSPAQLVAVVHAPSISLRPDGAGRIMMRSGPIDRTIGEDTRTCPLPEFASAVMEAATRVLPDLASASIDAVRIAARSIPQDGLPVVGPIDSVAGLYVACTHSGVTLGPLLGRLVAKEVISDSLNSRLAPYRPSRLSALQETVTS